MHQAMCCRAITALAASPASHAALIEAGSVELICASMEEHGDDSPLLTAGCEALRAVRN